MKIEPVDPFDDAAVNAWHEVYRLTSEHDRIDGDPWSREESRLELQQESSVIERRAFLGREDDEVVASGWIALPKVDNTHSAAVGVFVLPEQRKHGYGTALYEFLEVQAREAGRSTITSNTYYPYDAGSEGFGTPGADFARHHGFELALGDVRRRLSLPMSAELLDRLEGEAATSSVDYTVRTWVGPVPDDIVDEWAVLEASIETEAPTGDLDIEPETADVKAVREQDELIARQDRAQLHAVALDGDGHVVAYTMLVVPDEENRAYQWGTLVHQNDRGHKLGLRLKVANARQLQRERPDVVSIITYNASSNGHMVLVNERMGFRAIERLGEFQKRL